MKKIFVPLLLMVYLISGCKADLKTPTPLEPTSTTAPVTTDVPPVPGDLGWGKIHGKIIDAFTGEPIAGAVVTCEHHSYTSPMTCSGTATTDEDGMYLFENVFFHDTDTIKLTVQAPGYRTQEITSTFFTMADMEVNLALSRLP